MIDKLFNTKELETEEHWVSISDLMAGLMVIFLFISISYMLDVKRETDDVNRRTEEIRKSKDEYNAVRANLAADLRKEFEGSPEQKIQFRTKWKGYLDIKALSIRFNQPFAIGKSDLPSAFKDLLDSFFPRYIAILTKDEYREKIEEIRIEGHTSSEWNENERYVEIKGNEAYVKNMVLSQNRARDVLHYVLQIEHHAIEDKVWIQNKLTANGLSSSQLILNLSPDLLYSADLHRTVGEETGIPLQKINRVHQRIRNWTRDKKVPHDIIITNLISEFTEFKQKRALLKRAVDLLMEDKEASRRVEFQIITKSQKLIDEIEHLLKKFGNTEVIN
ncbi:MAG: OmpA family protein [Candidatus Poribacteria bacterium]|nr:OmpA family protein [Candidatus Poribacteria bacterium]